MDYPGPINLSTFVNVLLNIMGETVLIPLYKYLVIHTFLEFIYKTGRFLTCLKALEFLAFPATSNGSLWIQIKLAHVTRVFRFCSFYSRERSIRFLKQEFSVEELSKLCLPYQRCEQNHKNRSSALLKFTADNPYEILDFESVDSFSA